MSAYIKNIDDPSDPSISLTGADLTTALDDTNGWGEVLYKSKERPSNSWTFPIVTGSNYFMKWMNNLDFEVMKVDLSTFWQATDLPTFFHFHYIDRRELIKVTKADEDVYPYEETDFVALQTSDFTGFENGDNWKSDLDDTTNRFTVHFGLQDDNDSKSLRLDGIRCILPSQCYGEDLDVPLEDRFRFWSNPADWIDASGNTAFLDCAGEPRLPREGENVEIKAGWNMILDTDTSVIPLLLINGRLSYREDISGRDITLRANHIFVRGNGELFAGSEDVRYTANNGKIVLYGTSANQNIQRAMTIEAGDKKIVNTGKIRIWGKNQANQMTRLTAIANAGATSITVESASGWSSGQEIGIAATSYSAGQGEVRTISSVSGNIISFTTPLAYSHFGSSNPADYLFNGVDIRGEVTMLSRDFKITTPSLCSATT